LKKILLLFSFFIFAMAGEIDSIYKESYKYEKMANYKDAIKVLMPLYKKYPNGYTLNLRLGYLFSMNKDYKTAINYYKKASLILPNSFEPQLGLMKIYLLMHKYQKVTQIGFSILKFDYYNYYTNLYIINSLIAQRKYDDALKFVNKILNIYPTDVTYLTKLAQIYEIKNPAYAKKIYEDSILILDPNNIQAKRYLNKYK
jgi:tetratricopeptide (TPR) repeat protein